MKLQISPKELERHSLKLFLQQRLRIIETQLLDLARRYGVETVFELDALIQQGQLHETESAAGPTEDFFTFDNLEAEKEMVQKLLDEL
jgi:hypothetical protein